MEGRLPAEGFEQLRLKSRPELATSALARVGSGVYSTVQQQDYSASVWLSRKERLEHSQQKCIVVFALVCCFAVLVALIFSAVDIWDQDEDGITEDNCNKNCRVVLVETIPEDLPYSSNDTAHVPLSSGLHSLLDLAKKTVEVVSPHWNLNFTNENYSSPLARQGQDLFERLLKLGSQQVSLKVASGLGHSKDLNSLYDSGAVRLHISTQVVSVMSQLQAVSVINQLQAVSVMRLQLQAMSVMRQFQVLVVMRQLQVLVVMRQLQVLVVMRQVQVLVVMMQLQAMMRQLQAVVVMRQLQAVVVMRPQLQAMSVMRQLQAVSLMSQLQAKSVMRQLQAMSVMRQLQAVVVMRQLQAMSEMRQLQAVLVMRQLQAVVVMNQLQAVVVMRQLQEVVVMRPQLQAISVMMQLQEVVVMRQLQAMSVMGQLQAVVVMRQLRLSQTKELGVIIYNCSCLALDLHRIFTLYWQLNYKDFVPSMWSKRVFALYNKDRMLKVHLNDTKAEVFISSSPDTFCPKDRTKDIDAIYKVISDARRFIYISITEYLPLVNRSPHRYWSRIDGMLREALILRDIKVRLLISCWTQTNPLTFNFVWSLKTLCTERPNCTLEVKFFSPKEQRNGTAYTINRNKFMVTDNALYIGNFDWVGNEFAYNAGAGLVIRQENRTNHTILDQLKTVFERDWYSRHSKSLQANKIPECIKHRMNQPASPKGSQYSV
nr:PREDICTED: inactive phospholipase D5 [Lepisosteus oculatus]